jgi:NCAIR mutase (PurE)-related protein
MERDDIRRLLRDVRARRTSVDQAVDLLRRGHVEALEFATLDLHRALRRGTPEAVYGEGKSPEQIERIVDRLHAAGQTVMVTRVGPDVYRHVEARHPSAKYHETARAIVLLPKSMRRRRRRPGVVVVSAGTSDLGVAEEAAVTAETMGNDVRRVRDVGVAGLHRMLSHREALLSANVIVVVAGMEGALPSVVAGLVDCPVIGVPTSTGYGTGEGGRAALLAMLNSCAGGLTVVNIDNGYGAGYAAGTINARARSRKKTIS